MNKLMWRVGVSFMFGVGACGGQGGAGPGAVDGATADGAVAQDGGATDAPASGVDAATGACGTVLTTSVTIDDTDTAGDLAALAGVSSIKSLTVSAKNLTSLAGLECLHTVSETFFVTGTEKLGNLDALAGLREVGGVIIQNNSGLTSIAALENLTKLGGAQIDNNKALPECAAEHFKTVMVAKGVPAAQFFIVGNGSGTCP